MRFTRNRLVLAGLALLCCSQAALAELIVTRSNATPRYRVGMRLPDNHTFVLAQGQSVSLRRTAGGNAHVQGPATGPLPMLVRQGRARINTARTGS